MPPLQKQDQQSQSGGIATPPFVPGEIPGVPDANQKAATMLNFLRQLATRKQMANTAVPQGITPMEDPRAAQQIGMGTMNPHAWGTQRFLGGVATNIRNAVRQHKEKQLTAAEGDWTYLQSAMNELYAAQGAGDQQGAAAAQKKLDFILSDQKKLKNMAKALNQDWLNPEKTTVYGEAMKNVAQRSGQQAQAMHGLKGMMMKLLGQKQQLQLTVDQQRKMIGEIQGRAPVTTTGIDKETALALREQMRDESRIAEDERKQAAKDKAEAQKEDWRREDEQMKQKFQTQRDQMNNAFRERMESMKELATEQRTNAHDMAMMKMLGMKLDAQTEKLFKTDQGKIEKEVNDSVTTFRQQLAQSEQNLRSLKSQASSHWLMGPGKDDIADAQAQVDSMKKAIGHLEKNRDAIVKGKADLGDVINKAYDIMGGGTEATSVPGFKAD